jgi:CheY-like chemotaxis protein
MPESDRRTILLVEDEPANRALVAAILSRADGRLGQVEMVEADTLQSAREALASRVVDLVLLDVRLPDGSGLDLVDEIAALPAERRPRIVIMSASVLPHEREAALRSGADSFLGKPCRPTDLIETIAALFAGRPIDLGATAIS